MPIPCVDLLVTDPQNRILLVKRNNEPAKGEWWFPGGRVHYGELRKDAAVRKLQEECGLISHDIVELGTFDVLLDLPDSASSSHGITTLYHVKIKNDPVTLDTQSCEYAWKTYVDWKKNKLHKFVASSMLYNKRD